MTLPAALRINWFRLTVLLLALLIGIVEIITVHFVSASSTHWTSGAGTHSSGSHLTNPAHVSLRVTSTNSGNITSGGRYHDWVNCGGYAYGAVFCSGDWSLDIGPTAACFDDPPCESYLTIDYWGCCGSGSSDGINWNYDFWIGAETIAGDYLPGRSGDDACQWAQMEVRVAYTKTNGQPSGDLVIGYIWMIHNWYWPHTGGNALIFANQTRPSQMGTGSIHYIYREHIGDVYPGSGGCSSAAHTHIEFESPHDWGAAVEWHSGSEESGPDYYSAPSAHVHQGQGMPCGSGCTAYASGAWDAVTLSRTLGGLGGSSFSFYMYNNPYYSNH